MDAGIAAREGDVGVAQDGERFVAVVEAAGQVAELRAVVAGVAVGEPGDVGAVLAGGGIGAEVDCLEGHGQGGQEGC